MENKENHVQKPEQKEKKLSNVQIALIDAKRKMELIMPNEKETVAKEIGFAFMQIEKNKELQVATQSSIVNAILDIARNGLSLSPVLRMCYLVPFYNKDKKAHEAQAIISYIGLIYLLKKKGGIKDIRAYIVYDDEEFSVDILQGTINHKPKYVITEEEQKKRKIKGGYSRAILKDGTVVFGEFMPLWEIEKHKKVSKSANFAGSIWEQWYEDMIKKTIIRRDFKFYLDDFSTLLDVEERNDDYIDNDKMIELTEHDFDVISSKTNENKEIVENKEQNNSGKLNL